MSWQIGISLSLFFLIGLVAILYLIRVKIKGQVHYDRIDRQGGSLLLSKRLMEMGYWFFQPFARLLVSLGVTANQISWCSLLFAVIAGVCLSQGSFGSAAAFSGLSAGLDAFDGLVARLTGTATQAGEVLDSSLDRYSEFCFFGGLVFYYRELPAVLLLVLLALLGAFMVSYSTAKAEALKIIPPRGNMRRPERAVYLTLGAALSPVSIYYFENPPEYPLPIAHPMICGLAIVALFANISAIERLWTVAKLARQRQEKLLEKKAEPKRLTA